MVQQRWSAAQQVVCPRYEQATSSDPQRSGESAALTPVRALALRDTQYEPLPSSSHLELSGQHTDCTSPLQ